MSFVGQFCFVDSKDVTGALPGDILLIFADAGKYGFDWGDKERSGLRFEWVSISESPLITGRNVPETDWIPMPCYGSIYRTFDYAESDRFSQYDDHDKLSVLEATKIGGLPVWTQDAASLPGRFLCSLASIEPAISGNFQAIKVKPFPYLNKPDPIEFNEWYHSGTLRWGDMGVLNIFVDTSGQIHWAIQHH